MQLVIRFSRRRFGQGGLLTLALFTVAGRGVANDVPTNAVIHIRDFAFHPPLLEIRVGDSVTWTNGDLVPHTASAGDGSWDTDELGRNESAQVTFGAPGDFPYTCAFHPAMTGRVLVRPRDGA